MESRKIMLIITLMSCFSLTFAQCRKDRPFTHKAGYFDLDATEEINMLDRQYNETKEKQDETQVVLGTFANLVQNMVNIAVNPHNPSNVANNIIQMIAGIVGTSVQLSRNLPIDISIEERQQFLNDLEDCLKKELRSLVIAKKAMLRKCAVR